MWLLIDDERDLNCEIIARTPEAGKLLLNSGNCWECLCLDHDLSTKETGYDILKWAFSLDLVPKRVQLVTSNPVGQQNMANLLRNKDYFSKDCINFYTSNMLI